MKRILFFLSLLCCTVTAQAQTAAAYTFIALPSPYASIVATGTAVPSLSGDNVTVPSIPIGFTFTYCGIPYTTFSASSNGWISLTESPSVAAANTSGAISGPGWLMPYWDDLDGTTGTAYYETQGSAPNRVFVFEWHDWQTVSGSGTGSFQIKFYETFNLIDFHYGPTTISGTSATIGISNDNVSDWQTTSDGSTSPAVLAAPAFTTSVPSPAPDGWLYRWTPSSCPVAPITGPSSICTGGNTIVFSATAGCTWSSSNTAVAFIAAGTGTVIGLTVGTTTLSYISPLGCYATKTFTVTAVPDISGTFSLCTGVPVTYTHPSPGGTWTSSNITVATVTPTTGVVTGVAAGTAKITYTIPGGCKATAYITVNASPSDVTGTFTLCQGSSTALASGPPGGTWSSSATGVATVDAAGNVSGISGGTANISYTLATGCFRAGTVTVNPLPAAITGGTSLCILGSMPLASTTPGGTWASSAPAIATVSGTGVVTAGPTAGTSVISYTLPSGCYVTTTISVVVVVAPILGPSTACMLQTPSYTNASPGGTWASSSPAAGTISTAGVLTPIAVGATTLTYTLGSGCYVTLPVTVADNALISGPSTVCAGSSVTLTNSIATGTGWSLSTGAPLTFTAAAGTATITGTAAGTGTVSYTNGAGCVSTKAMTVLPVPSTITGTLGICLGNTSILGSTPAGGTWSSASTSVVTIDPSTGLASAAGAGTAGITYTSTNGCSATAVATVSPLPAAIGGTATVCPGYTTTLTHAVPGGTWTSSDVAIATVNSSGGLTGVSTAGGTATITYTPPASVCSITRVATVLPAPAITGASSVCVGANTTLSSSMTGSTWTSTNTSVATIGLSTGTVNGIASGTTTITVFGSNGCTASRVFTVNPVPSSITGAGTVCVTANTALTGSPAGGTWASANAGIASIDAAGTVTGVTANTTTITYTLAGCYRTTVVTVNALPATITGPSAVCSGASAVFSSSPAGTWSSSNTTVAPIDAASGATTGGGAGTATISYTLPTGCFRTRTFTVNALPAAIGGPTTICLASTVTLTSTTGGGAWTSSNPGVASIVAGTGVVTGAGIGTSGITYTLGTGCNTTAVVTVISAPPAVITPVGSTAICPGDFVTLAAATVSGATYEWYNGGTLIPGAVSPSYAAGASGSYQVQVSLSAGCSALSSAVMVTVTPAIAAITVPGGVTTACAGTPIAMNATPGAGLTYQWTLAGADIPGATASSYSSTTGGTYGVKVVNAAGCSATSASVVLTAIPVPSGVVTTSGSLAVCSGSNVTLTAASGTSYFYQWRNAAGVIPGATSASYTTGTAGSYHVVITGLSGCTTTTAASVVVVNPRPTATITASGPRVFCTGGSVTLNAPAGFNYQWYRNGVAIPGANSVSYPASLGGGYRVRVINTVTGCADTTHADTVVSVIAAPSIVPLTALKFCTGGSALLSTSVSSLGSALSYQWSLNGTPLTGATGSTYNATVPGLYVCTISVPSSCVVSTAPVTVTQVALPTPSLTYAGGVLSTASDYATYQWYKDMAVLPGATSYSYTPTVVASYQVRVADANGCESSSSAYLVNTVSSPLVENVDNASVRIFPNPAHSTVHVESKLATRVSISSIDGRKLIDLTNVNDIDISHLADGIYLISVFSADNQLLKTGRLVKRSE